MMDELVEWLEGKNKWDKKERIWRHWKPEERPFRISSTTALNWIRDIFGTYPHFYRFSFITDGFKDQETGVSHMKSKTGLSLAALNIYLQATDRLQDEMDQRKLARMRKEGLIE